jgi:PAS domain S-box-containing protein
LLIEDNHEEARLIQELLKDTPGAAFDLTWADRLDIGLQCLQRNHVDVILLDLLLPQSEGMDTFTQVYTHAPRAPIIVLSGLGDRELATHIVQAGAQDYLVKGQVDRELLVRAIRYAIERKQIEEALRESESRYRAVSELTSDFSYSIGVLPGNKLVHEWSTEAFNRATGFRLEEILQNGGWQQIVHPDDLPSIAWHIRTRLSGEPSVGEFRIITKSGEELWVRDHGRPVWDERQQRVVRIYGAAQDISRYKQAEQALRESEEKLRAQYKGIPIPTYTWQKYGNDFVLVEYNEAAYQITQGKIADAVGTKASQMYENMPRVLNDFQRCYNEQIPIEREMLYRYHAGGTNRHLSVKYAFVPPDLVMVHTEDITERKHAEQDVGQRAAQLALLNSISGEIAAVLELDDVLNRATHLVQEVFGYHRVAIFTIDHEHGELMMNTRAGDFTSLLPKGHRWKLGQGMVGWVGRYSKTLIANDVSIEPRYVNLFPGVIPTQSALCVPIRAGREIIGVLDVQSPQLNAFDENNVMVLETLADQIAIAIKNARLFEEVRTSRERLKALSHRLVEMQEKERRHIARELHDEIGQVLTGLKLVLDMTTRMPAAQIRQNLKEAQELVNDLMTRVRDMSLDLRPAMLDDLGLLPTLLWHFERYTNQTNVRVTFKHTGMKGNRFTPEVETAAYRIIQEALTNVARHAEVDQVVVRIWTDRDTLNLQIADQGVGFDFHSTLYAGSSNGLTSMLERAALLGGHLTIESAPSAGTHITVELPLKPAGGDERGEAK